MQEDTFEKTRQSLAASIKARRDARGLSQEALALEAGVDRTFVSQIERGIGNPSLRIVCLLADQLDATPFELIAPGK